MPILERFRRRGEGGGGERGEEGGGRRRGRRREEEGVGGRRREEGGGKKGGEGREREREERERKCKIPLYNLDSQSNLSTRSILSPINHTQRTLYATRQLSSLARASLEPMPFGIVASTDAS